MSKQEKGKSCQDLPTKKDGTIDLEELPKDENGMTEIDRSAEEAYNNGDLEMVDILGNRTPASKKDDIMHEMFTGTEKPLDVDKVLGVVKHLQGKILTIIDASFTDLNRVKFVKDLIKDSFSTSSNWIFEMSIREFVDEPHGMVSEDLPSGTEE